MIGKMSFRKAAKKNKFNKKCAKPMRGKCFKYFPLLKNAKVNLNTQKTSS